MNITECGCHQCISGETEGKHFLTMTPVEESLAKWLSAALDDQKICKEMKDDIRNWLDLYEYEGAKSADKENEVEKHIKVIRAISSARFSYFKKEWKFPTDLYVGKNEYKSIEYVTTEKINYIVPGLMNVYVPGKGNVKMKLDHQSYMDMHLHITNDESHINVC